MTATWDWGDFRAPAFESIDPMKTIAVLPTAAIEQHGPHLPVGTDAIIARGMLEEVRCLLPDHMDVRILPLQSVGKSNEHQWAAGTLTLTAATALNVWTDIGLSVARAGVRKLAVINSHGGNLDLISILSRELRVQANMLAVKCQWGSFGAPDGVFSDRENRFGIHGGDLETSLMLHFRPDTVDMDAARDFGSSAEHGVLQPIGPISYGWIARDLNPAGVVGEAHLATAKKGSATARHQAAGFVDLLKSIEQAALPGT
ncbi:creatininase family protein [Roseobacter sp. EG26]|uniref:creatininase family protein n=1 Tax=Roseobacter sp. EG26 TaxID=3412477 RepID=UPI003CE4CC59